MRCRYLIVGADSLIGQALERHLKRFATVIGTSRRRQTDGRIYLDLADSLENWPTPAADTAFLCASVPSEPECRRDPVLSHRINVVHTLELARRLAGQGTHVIFLSSSQVFDGTTLHAKGTDTPSPRTLYGQHKAAVEAAMLETLGPQATILRVTKVLSLDTPLFQRWYADLKRGEPVSAFTDMRVAPVSLADVMETLGKLADGRHTGIYQLSGAEDISYYDLAVEFAALLETPPALVLRSEAARSGVPPELRPRHAALDGSRLQRDLGIEPPSIRQVLDKMLTLALFPEDYAE